MKNYAKTHAAKVEIKFQVKRNAPICANAITLSYCIRTQESNPPRHTRDVGGEGGMVTAQIIW